MHGGCRFESGSMMMLLLPYRMPSNAIDHELMCGDVRDARRVVSSSARANKSSRSS